jgi:hypothetical protein
VPVVATRIDSKIPRMVFDDPNNGRRSRNMTPASGGQAKVPPKIFSAMTGAPFARVDSTIDCALSETLSEDCASHRQLIGWGSTGDRRRSAMRFFFYGTLLDPECRRVVIGRDIPVVAATLFGWRRLGVAGKHFPMIQRDAKGSTAGAVTDPLGVRDVARLRYYEGDSYHLVAVEVRHEGGAGVAATVFAPPDGSLVGVGTWSLGDWQRDHRAAVLDRLRAYDWPQS